MEEKESQIIDESQNKEVSKEEKPEPKKGWFYYMKGKNIHEVTPENDIKYRGPLSYRHLRIIAWIFLALAQIGTILTLSASANEIPDMYGLWPTILHFFANFMGPLFLIAAFATVLVAKDGYKRLIVLYSGLSLLMYVAFVIIYQHFIVGIVGAITTTDPNTAAKEIVQLFTNNGFLAFNIFLDLLLCTLVTFFINYNPKKYFQGKKIVWFRLLVLLPIAYEVVSILLKVLCSNEIISLSPFVFPLLTTKAPVSFIIFVAMAIFMKHREKYFVKKGKTLEHYAEFKKTNVNSLQFSFFLSIIIIGAVIIDFSIFLGATIISIYNTSLPEGVDLTNVFFFEANKVYSWGFGQTVPLILIIPLVILFDYKKTYKDKKLDTLIPIAGIALLLIVYIEGGFEVLKVFLRDITQSANADSGEEAISVIKHFLKRDK